MAEKVKRSLQATYLNVAGAGADSEKYALLGVNVSELSISYNPQTNTEQDVVSDSASTDLTGYQPSAAVSQSATKGDEVYDYINGLRRKRAILADSYSDIILVDLYETPASGSAYPAERQPVSIQIDTYGGAGTDPLSIEYTLNFRGDAEQGTFDPTTKTFTPGSSPSPKARSSFENEVEV